MRIGGTRDTRCDAGIVRRDPPRHAAQHHSTRPRPLDAIVSTLSGPPCQPCVAKSIERRSDRHACVIERSAGPAGRLRKSATACGAWPAGPAATTSSRSPRSIGPSISAATSSTRPGPTATATASGCSAQTLNRHPGKRLYVATKIPPKNRKWPAQPGVRRSTRSSPPTTSASTPRRAWRTSACRRSTCSSSTSGPTSGRPTRAGSGPLRALKDEGLVRAFGISVNRWQPANVLRALDTGLIDAVQVVYNVFDQSPEDELFPYLPEARDRHHRAGALRRRQPDRHADRRRLDLAAGRLPQPLFQRRATLRPRSPGSTALRPRRSGRHDHAGAGATAHPRPPGRLDRDSRACASSSHVEQNIAVSDGQALAGQLYDGARSAPLGAHGRLRVDCNC